MKTWQWDAEAVTEQKLNSKQTAKPVDKSDAGRRVSIMLKSKLSFW